MRVHEVGKRIRHVRESLGLTQAEFAKRLGVTRISVARYEAGQVPNLSLLRHVARLGRVDLGWILEEEPSRGPSRDQSTVRRQDVADTFQDLVAFLKRETGRLARLPRHYRRRYKERLQELLERMRRDLEDYRGLLEDRRGSSNKTKARPTSRG
jgi:transcriptional regulator with XRE-family HTH domain